MYQIQIWARRYDQFVDMAAVCAALSDLMTEDQVLPDGADARERDCVYVRFGTVAEALRRINALGYATDEDEDEPDPGEDDDEYVGDEDE